MIITLTFQNNKKVVAHSGCVNAREIYKWKKVVSLWSVCGECGPFQCNRGELGRGGGGAEAVNEGFYSQ